MPKLSIVTVTRSRPQLLARAIDSLKSQSSQDFEWIVVNDGKDIATKQLITDAGIEFPFTYLGMLHPERGFALSYGRNRGLTVAVEDIVTYLDDDNTLKPNFVAETLAFFQSHPQMDYAMPTQQRRRDVIRDGLVVGSGKEFFSPSPDCTIEQLIRHQQLIDSNGFAHRNTRDLSLMWNPSLKIYIDYEFLLRCINRWGRSSFKMNPATLVDYVQTNQGAIGSSSYRQWAEELDWIIAHKQLYPCLKETDIHNLYQLMSEYLIRHNKIKNINSFASLN
jgi:glycosyltransferase involved in cell wall biosynthesis